MADASSFLGMDTGVSDLPIPSSNDVRFEGYHAGIRSSIQPVTVGMYKFALSKRCSFSSYTHTLYPMKWQEKTSKETQNQNAQENRKCVPIASHTRS
jgi:hypothetical protein